MSTKDLRKFTNMSRILKTTAVITGTLLLILTLYSPYTIWPASTNQIQEQEAVVYFELESKLLEISVSNKTATSNTTNCPIYKDFIRHRLETAESNWKKANERKNQAITQVQLNNGVDLGQARIVWDFFYPSFDCPFAKERIGRLGDGGKWICGFENLFNKPKCIVYSFGVRDDTSFEEEILQRTENCIVRMFDPTLESNDPDIINKYKNRAFFYRIGITGSESVASSMKTLKMIMEENGDESLDILKMDVEGAEWESMQSISDDFPEKLPFAQLQVELHLNRIQHYEWLNFLSDWWKKLEAKGLREFFREANLLNGLRLEFREISFLNTRMEPFLHSPE